jgi:hypothetical protein
MLVTLVKALEISLKLNHILLQITLMATQLLKTQELLTLKVNSNQKVTQSVLQIQE